MTAATLNEHVRTLCEEHGVWYRNGNRKGRAQPALKLFHAPEVKGQVTYFLALHELAHCVQRHHSRRLHRLQQEAEAWQWALDHALVDPTPATARRLYRRLCSYLRAYTAVNMRAGRPVRFIPPREDPAWDTFDLLARLAEIPPEGWQHNRS